MASGGVETPIPASLFARLKAATRFVVSGAGGESWFGPQQPLKPQAPAQVKGRQWDYPFGLNINYTPRSDSLLSFGELRALADALPLLRAVIETRKDQISALHWTVRPRLTGASAGAQARAEAVRAALAYPDRAHDFATWLRILVEDMLVIDAACLYPRYDRGGQVHSLDVIDGATIKPLIGEDGRAPAAPEPAYQQVLHGVPAADFSCEELFYLPRNVRSHRLYGFSPVEQIALTVNIALRREQATLDYYNTGSVPDSFATLPKDWTVDQIRQFQDYFDALMAGNLARRRMVKFMPSEFKLTQTREPPLKDMYDEWLARVICYAFSVPVSAFVTQVNRATSLTLRTQAAQEGLAPLKSWVKQALDRVIGLCFGGPDLEFVWIGDDGIDPLEQAKTIEILVRAGVKTVAEARVELGLGGGAKVVKFNPRHDEQGRFATADAAGSSNPGNDKEPDADQDDERSTAEIRDVAYQGDFHDKVVRDELQRYQDAGAKCISETRLSLGDVTARLDILCRTKNGELIGVEVKTGDNPDFTPSQVVVYEHTMAGGVTSPDQKISQLGIAPNTPLPPFPVILLYSAGPGAPKRMFAPKDYSIDEGGP